MNRFPAFLLAVISFMTICCNRNAIVEKELISENGKAAKTLSNSTNWEERVRAIELLSTNQSQSYERLIITSTEDEHPRVRMEALNALSSYKTKTALGTIIKSAENETDKNVKWIALQSLSRYENPHSTATFITAMSHEDWIIRETAVIGLLKIKGIDSSVIVPYIVRLLADPSENVKIAALQNLSFADSSIYPFFKKTLSENDLVRKQSYLQAVLTALSYYELDDGTRKKVLSLINHQNAEIRVLALRCIKNSDMKKKSALEKPVKE